MVTIDGLEIPPPLSPFGCYPNPLHITDADRATFHPVVKFPTATPHVFDFTTPTSGTTLQLATEEERHASREGQTVAARPIIHHPYAIGRYDENRQGLYESALFDDISNDIDGFAGQRTVHVGIDLDGPVGTPVHAFGNGCIHSAGYNPDLGDYGNVVVIRHDLPLSSSSMKNHRHVYALYGHLTDSSISQNNCQVGQSVAAGDVIGAMGDIHENGGWFIPHVHFQLSVQPPKTHDMPGVVSLADRPKALLEYPDPRWVLGALY